MAFTVQNDTGTQAGANAYITVAEFKAYHTDRGNSYAGLSDTVLEQRIVRATDYIDYSRTWRGDLLEEDQTTEFPRVDLYDRRNKLVEGVPQPIKDACAEYALRTELWVDAPAVAAGIKRERVKLDVLETETEYSGSSASGGRSWPSVPAADMIIKRSGYSISTGGRVARA